MPDETNVPPRPARRPDRRAEILAATRALFDEAGSRDAQIEDIARAVGVNRAIIYRHFSSKEEVFAEVVVSYLGELQADLEAAARASDDPEVQLAGLTDGLIDFGLRHPAFVDCALTLIRRTGDALMDEVGESAMVRLGTAMWHCLSPVVATLEAGQDAGVFRVEDPTLLANLYYAEALGILSFAALQMSVGRDVSVTSTVPVDQIKQLARLSALGQARGH